MPRRLIVNADDLGFTLGVTRGIIKTHQEGIVTSSSVMVNMPAADESIKMVQRDAPDLGIGLHLTLTAGSPVAPAKEIPDLLEQDGRFRHKTETVAHLPSIDLSQVERELRAQLDLFVRLAGQPPDHLDSHHHITYLAPSVFSLMAQLACEFDIPIRKPLTANPQDGATFLMELGAAPNETAAKKMLAALQSAMNETRIPMPGHFIAGFYAQHTTLGDLLNLLLDLPAGVTELMCHPAEVDESLRATSGYIDYRTAELESLIHPSVREVIQAEGIELITFRDLISDG